MIAFRCAVDVVMHCLVITARACHGGTIICTDVSTTFTTSLHFRQSKEAGPKVGSGSEKAFSNAVYHRLAAVRAQWQVSVTRFTSKPCERHPYALVTTFFSCIRPDRSLRIHTAS